MMKYEPTNNYKLWLKSNCPKKNTCIGFTRAVQTDTGIKPCTAIYHCPFAQEQMWKWKTPPK